MVSLDKEMMTPVNSLAPGRTWLRYGFIMVFAAVLVAIISFVILIGLTPIRPDDTVAITAVIINGMFVAGLLVLIGIELKRIINARRYGRAGARLHVRIVTLFSIIAAAPALAVAIVAAITLDLGLDRWFEIRTRTIVESSREVAESYINENAINLRDASINMAFSMDNQSRLFRLDQRGFRDYLTQQAKGRGMLGASIIRPDGAVIHSADIATSEPLPLPPKDALETAKDGAPVIIPPGSTNLVGALIMLREIENAVLYTVRSVDADALNAVRLMEQNRLEYSNLEGNRPVLQLAFAILYFGLTLIMLLSAIWTGIAVANRIVRPIRQLITASDEVAGGNLEVRVPVRSSDGDVAHLGETFNDMIVQLKTQRNDLLTARDTIDERRRFSEAVLSGVSAGVLGVGREGLVHVANRSASHILTGSNQEITGRPLSEISPSIAEAYSDMAANNRDDLRRQVTFVDSGGRERVLNVQLTLDREPQSNEDQERSNTDVLTIDDISDLMEAQRSSAWADVARRIAHEIKNPLTPIQLSAERIRRRFGKHIAEEDRGVFDQCTDTIIRQVGDIGRMVDEFSSFARMPKPVMEMQDLRTVIKEAAFLVEVSRNEIKFDHDFGDKALVCLLDDRLIGQAIGNVIKNASEAVESNILEGRLEDDGGHILIRAYVANDQWIYLDVIDNGRGFPISNRQRLLEPYMTTREKGTGLGLAIVRKIMEEHHGRLELHDAPQDHNGGAGAMVRMLFPRTDSALPERTDKIKSTDTQSVENPV